MPIPFLLFLINSELVQVLVFVSHDIISSSRKVEWLLLRALRSFTIIDLYLAFEEHTQLTINTGRQQLREFEKIMEAFTSS
jgi:hypothetical protein